VKFTAFDTCEYRRMGADIQADNHTFVPVRDADFKD
jgi:hypothetical protein